MSSKITHLYVLQSQSNNPATPDGYTRINKDCSKGASGWYNYVCFKKAAGSSPIIQIQSRITEGRQSNGGSANGWTMAAGSDNGDLNRGSGGKYIYLYYHTSPTQGYSGYTDLDIIYGESTVVPVGWEKVSNDLNQSVGGEYVYLIARRA